jgi:hypothetical protein
VSTGDILRVLERLFVNQNFKTGHSGLVWHGKKKNSSLREGKDSFHYVDVQHGGELSSASQEATSSLRTRWKGPVRTAARSSPKLLGEVLPLRKYACCRPAVSLVFASRGRSALACDPARALSAGFYAPRDALTK